MKPSIQLTKLAKALILAADFPIYGRIYNLLRGKLLEKSDKPGNVLPEHRALAEKLSAAYSSGNERLLADLYFKNREIFDPIPEEIFKRLKSLGEILEVPPVIEEYDPKILQNQVEALFIKIKNILARKSAPLGVIVGVAPKFKGYIDRALHAKNNRDLVRSFRELYNILEELKEVKEV